MYRPALDIVPVVKFPPCASFTCQMIAVFVVPVMFAENCLLPPAATVAEVGEIVTEMPGAGAEALRLTVALADDAEFAMLVAATVTDPPDGTDAGAVYRPEDVIVPVAEPPPTTPFTDHV